MSHRQTVPRQRIKRPNIGQDGAEIFRNPAGYQPRRRRYLGNPLKLKRRNKSVKAACLQILLSFGICMIYFYFATRTSEDCNLNDPMCPNKYFTNSYNEARQRFIKYSSKIHDAKTYNLPIIKIKSDIDYGVEQILYTDITIINAAAKKSDHLIVHISGIHGIEGFTGSAIQCAILSEMAQMTIKKHSNQTKRYQRKLLDGLLLNHNNKKWMNHKEGVDSYDINDFPVIMFVHSLNPFGMFYGLKVNENNVDLNRNLKTKQEWNQFNDDERNKHDNDMDNFLNPQYNIKNMIEFTNTWIPGSTFFKINWIIQYIWSYLIDWYLKTQIYGYYTMKYMENIDGLFERYTVGQNYDENGLEFVGNDKEKSHVMLMNFLKERFEENEWYEQFKKITLIDVHSGYGEYGTDTMTVSNDEHLNEIQRIGKKFRAKTMIQSTDYKNKKFANGIYKNVNGMSYKYIDFIIDNLMKKGEIDKLGVLQHFGTYSREYMLNTVRFHHSYNKEYNEYLKNMDQDNEEQKEILKLMKFLMSYSSNILNDAFYVKELDWKRTVVQDGYYAFTALYHR